MYRSIKKRMLSGLLAGLLAVSNVNITANAADITFVSSYDEDNSMITEEESSPTYDTGQNQQSLDSADEDSYADSEVDFSDEADFADGTEEAENTSEAEIAFDSDEEAEQAGSDDSCFFALDESAEDIGDGETASTPAGVVTGTFRVTGQVTYDEQLDGTDWSPLVRPNEFNQPLKVTLTYIDSNGQVQSKVYNAQDDFSQNPFYLKFTHDGNGGGEFAIENIPKTVKDETGADCQITGYSVNVEPTLPYYESNIPISGQITDPSNIVATTGTLTLSLKTQTLTWKPTVTPDGSDTPSFKMNMSFTNPKLTGDEYDNRKLEKSCTATTENPAVVHIPLGIAYRVEQEVKEGYRLDKSYKTTVSKTTESGTVSETSTTSSGWANGTIEEKSNVTISTVNYAQNVEVGFDVEWIDNNKATRPTLSENNFVLQYKAMNDDGTWEWKELTQSDYESLGIAEADPPKFDISQTKLNKYAYTGLPAVDAKGRQLEYQVIVRTAPDGYIAGSRDDEQSKRRTFTFEEQTDFSATIRWNDQHYDDERPTEISGLRLYRKAGNGNYELVYDNLPDGAITRDDKNSEWSVKISDIPRYNAQNQEYDYVLVQGSIERDSDNKDQIIQDLIRNYKTHYNNGSGNFGNDITLCHNNGTITEVLYEEIDFHAKKEWKDSSGDENSRPTATVTLWRYIKDSAAGIDDAYMKGVAAQVVFQTRTSDGKVNENIASYNIRKDSDSAITFTSETVTDMPQDYKLPKYDDHGREYVYFVRESLSGDHENEFDIHYVTTDEQGNVTKTYQNGVPLGGKIENIRRKKEAVSVTKIWRNQSGLGDIDGVSVKLQIQARVDEEGYDYEDLTVYSDTPGSYSILSGADKETAQTITGFSSSIAEGEVSYYVNTCNSEGKPYDMTTAKFIESVTTKDGKSYTVTTAADGRSIIDMDGEQYVVQTAYQNSATLGDGMKQYRYTQTNTITALREYTLTKIWDDSISEKDMEEVTAVNFRLERRTANPDSSEGYVVVQNPETGSNIWSVPKENGKRTWTSVLTDLPRYDADGYEYYYRASEVSLTMRDGSDITAAQAERTKQWSGAHYRTLDETKVTNYVKGESSGFFTISKIWQDNGEIAIRKPVHVRIYRRSELKEELQKMQQSVDSEIDLSMLSTKYYETTITDRDQYTAFVYYRDLQKKLGIAPTDDSWENYVIIEYCVGDATADGAQPARYSYQQLLLAAQSSMDYNLSGTVENTLRKYNTTTSFDSSNNNVVLLINTRVGTTRINAEKTWQDDNNSSDTRPAAVKFQLYRNGSPYTNVPEKVTVTMTTDQSTEENSYVAELEHATGVITVKNKDLTAANAVSAWAFTVNGLDQFSDAGVSYSYNLDEVSSADDSQETTYSYIKRKGTTTVTTENKTQTYAFTFTNTVTGTVDHVAYKYWKDAGIGSTNRPDLYLNLYQYLKTEQREKRNTPLDELNSYTLYKDYKDQIWTAEPATPDPDEMEQGYNWKITVRDLPQFDSDGNEYGYVFTETMNNGGRTVLGTYVPSAQTKSDRLRKGTYEVFTNTITDYMTIQGKKTWTGLSGYQTKEEDLPDPDIVLYRTIDSDITDLQEKSDDEIKDLIEANKITQVDTTQLTGSSDKPKDKTRYTFPDAKAKEKAGFILNIDGKMMLPKFDANGNRYRYLVRESIVDPIASQLYSQLNTNGTLSNVFRSDLNRRTITVTKTWAGRENLSDKENKYPSVTYNLYRYEKGKEELTRTLIKTHTINSDEFAGQHGQASCVFRDLLIYSPTGVQYCYYIEEKPINGYTISYTDEAEVTDSTLSSNNRIDVISLPEKWNDEKASFDDLNTSTGTCNTYDNPGNVTLSGEKIWEDYSDIENLRPESINVKLTRHTEDEQGQTNKVESTDIKLLTKDAEDPAQKVPYIVWEKGSETQPSSVWKYKIYNLERYAPNGMPYIYTLSEEKVNGYKQANSVSNRADADEINMSAMTNRFETSYYVRKNWMDGNNKYNLRPTEITVKLQRSRDGGENWQDIPWREGFGTYDKTTGKWTGLPHVIGDGDDAIVSITLNAKYVIKNTRNNSWEYTFTNLPKQDKDGNIYSYRCVETAIGGAPLIESSQEGDNPKYSAGAYECKYTTQNETRTVIENTLDSTSLVVTKKWEGDQNNLYQTRPDELTFVLQKRGVMVKNETETTPGEDNNLQESQLSDWADVLDANGEPYTFTISAEDNWTKTLEDLPTAEVYIGKDGTEYTVYSLYFRAVEVHDETKDASDKKLYENRPLGALNYKDTTDYSTSDENTAHKYNEAEGRNESTITNELIVDKPAKSITVTKIWRRIAGNEVTATFELLYKTVDDNEWHHYTDPKLQAVSSTNATTSSVTWSNLPKYDQTGKELVYKVIELPINGYETHSNTNVNDLHEDADSTSFATEYTFTNIELQSYTVKKIWQNTDYSEKTGDVYTATFQLQKKAGTAGDWENVSDGSITLTTREVNDTVQHTWNNLPKYTVNGDEIIYRAVETKINGKPVADNTNGAYMVSYQYIVKDGSEEHPSFGNTMTTATNRIIYGFVNLSKQAAYLAPGTSGNEITGDSKNLQGVKFNIYQGKPDFKAPAIPDPYVSNVTTDTNGNLINDHGKYGDEKKYLVAGTYTLKEVETFPEYSVWADGITFTVGSGTQNNLSGDASLQNTGEHGTAWISTTGIGQIKLGLKVEYRPAVSKSGDVVTEHAFEDACVSYNNGTAAVNLESRGVLSFTKTGSKSNGTSTMLDTHDSAVGENSAYFGVYLDEVCTKQVAGMVPKATVVSGSTDKTTMILTDRDQNGNVLAKLQTEENNVPYLRAYSGNSDYPFTLLSGTYYLKELVAPAGYKLDTSVRKAEIKRLETDIDSDLSEIYPSNKAEISKVSGTVSSEKATDKYEWSNEPNVVTLYKMDQFGRKVPLAQDGYLELKIEGAGNTFPSGENTIRLYQNRRLAATKSDGTTKVNYVSYNEDTGAWTVRGLLEAGKTYILSEPDASVHANYLVAVSVPFKMKADGTIVLTDNGKEKDSTDATKRNDKPLEADGTDFINYYRPDASENLIVMRDTARYLKDIVLVKKDSQTKAAIPHISFELYKYNGTDEDGNPTECSSVLPEGIYLTTDKDGKIDLKDLSENVINQITGCALKYGLDIGKYYFREAEHGASDNYRLVEDIYFEISPKADGKNTEDYSDHAKVTYDTSDSHVSIPDGVGDDNKTVIVEDDPVSSSPKTLALTKVDSKAQNIKLANAKFVLTYQSVNHGDVGSATGTKDPEEKITWNCVTDSEGVLYLMDNEGKIKPDISRKGSYTLREVQAPDGYMTRTEKENVITMVTFKVDSSNQITDVTYYDGTGELVTSPDPAITTDAKTQEQILNFTVKNEKTKISVAKRNDIEGDRKTCNQKSLNGELLTGSELQIYEGTDTATEDRKLKATLSNGQSEWNWIKPDGTTENDSAYLSEGTLKENTIYTLHESKAPTGYLAADDIYFKLFGTTIKDSTVVSQLYVWTEEGIPSDVNADGWLEESGLKDNVLTMVDEAIIAPVDMQKVTGPDKEQEYQILEGAIFEVKAGEQVIGTARSASNGYLVWETISEEGYNTHLIFNETGERVINSAKADTVIGKTIILQQNAEGYTFTETYAPDHAYNDGKSYHVCITEANYVQYCTTTEKIPQYDTTRYINLVEAEGIPQHTVDNLSVRGSQTEYTDADAVNGKLAVNLPYKSTVTLHKYDGDEEGQKAAIPGTEFTLYRVAEDSRIYTKAYSVTAGADGMPDTKTANTTGIFTTDANGNITIEIHEKGTYILKETKAAAGYRLDASTASTFTFILADTARTDENNQKISYGYGETNRLQKDSDGVPNQRKMGEVSLTKEDARTHETLNEVAYILARTDIPKAPSADGTTGADLTEYLLQNQTEVVTGKSYKAEKVNGQWQLTESTGQTGKIYISGLNWGTYTLTEKTELPGYKLPTDNNGKAVNSHTFTIDGSSDQLTFTYQNTNEKNSVTLYKTNQLDLEAGVDSIKGLAGAVFEVHEGDPAGACDETCSRAFFYTSDTEGSTKVTTITTDENGKVTIYGLPTDTSENAQNPGNPKTYHLVEVKAPKGYKLQTTPVVFTIDRQGNVQLKTTDTDGQTKYIPAPYDGNKTTDANAQPMVTMQDEAIKLYIQKHGEDGTTPLKGAEFVLKDACNGNSEANDEHKLANGADSVSVTTSENGKVMIPIESVIGGHTYTLTETRAPEGYECTAVVTFHVKEDGTIDQLRSEGGYKGYTTADGDGNKVCASADTAGTTVRIMDEKIRMSLTKVDYANADTKLEGVTFTLKPYEDSSFAALFDRKGHGGITYDEETNTYTFTTDSNGKITFPDGLLKHDNSYLLQETKTAQNYYLSSEAKAGVILNVGKDGGITVGRLEKYEKNTMTGTTTSSCPVTVETSPGASDLIAKNMQSTSFDLTKKVSGNMGNLNGTFKINIKLWEPDGTYIGERTVDLRLNETYDSVNGISSSEDADKKSAFGKDAIPVGATLMITEENDLDYTAVVKITGGDGTVISRTPSDEKGTAKVTLNTSEKVFIELTNEKNITIDVGVNTENQTPWAAASLIIPALWLVYRYRRKRRGGEV